MRELARLLRALADRIDPPLEPRGRLRIGINETFTATTGGNVTWHVQKPNS